MRVGSLPPASSGGPSARQQGVPLQLGETSRDSRSATPAAARPGGVQPRPNWDRGLTVPENSERGGQVRRRE